MFESHLSELLISNIGKNCLSFLKTEKVKYSFYQQCQQLESYWNQSELKKNKISISLHGEFLLHSFQTRAIGNAWGFKFINQNFHEDRTHKEL